METWDCPNKNKSSYSHLVEIDETKRLLTIYRVNEIGEKMLFTSIDLPVLTFDKDSEAYRNFAQQLGENLLVDSPVARKIFGL